MNPGKQFENDVRASVPKDVYYLRLQDSANGFNRDDRAIRFALKSPYDAVLCRYGRMYCLELKSTSGKAISYDGKGPKIKPEQIAALRKAHMIGGATAGFLINFREVNKTFWIPIATFDAIRARSSRKSLSVKDAEAYGIKVPQRRLRIHDRYDLSVIWGNENE